MSQLLCIGECMIEFAPAAGGLFSMGFAGDTFNTAWYARKVAPPEVAIGYLTAVGDDSASDAMLAFMRTAGVVPHAARRGDRSVGLYLISLKDGERSFSYWRSASAARTLAENLEALETLGPGDVAYFSGITLGILPPEGRARLFAVLAESRARGVRIAFDPNLRPRLWDSAGEMCRVVMDGAAVADIALPSFEDESDHFGDPGLAATADRYTRAGATTVAVKNGAGDMLIRDTGDAVVTPDPAPAVVDTTAAGDSFNAAFLVALMAGRPPVEAAVEGARLAARVIGAPGALVDLSPGA